MSNLGRLSRLQGKASNALFDDESEQDDLASSLQKQVDVLQKTIISTNIIFAQANEENRKTTADLQEKNKKLQQDIDSLIKTCNKLKNENEELQEHCNESTRKSKKALQQQIDDVGLLREEKDRIEKERNKLQGKVEDLMVLNERQKQEIIALRRDKNERSTEINVADCRKLAAISSLNGIEGAMIRTLLTFEMNNVQYLVAGTNEGLVSLWNLKDKSRVEILSGQPHKKGVTSLVFYEIDGHGYIVSGGEDKLIKLYSLRTKSHITNLGYHSRAVTCLKTFKTMGVWTLASGGYDKQVELWNLNSQSSAGTLTGHTNVILALEFYFYGGESCIVSTGKVIRRTFSISVRYYATFLNQMFVFYINF